MSPYANAHISLLTQHGKERVVIPALESSLACRVIHVTGHDTDRYGTFTRDVPRAGTQHEAAVAKARRGMELSGLPIGTASEGSFARDPFLGLVPWNVEMLALVDGTRGIEIIGLSQGRAVSGHVSTGQWERVEEFAREIGFPEHWLIVRPSGEDDLRIFKEINSWAALRDSFDAALAASSNGLVFTEVDLRAHANPTRMELIKEAADDLARRALSLCPTCGTPGYWCTERAGGLPCAECGAPTQEPMTETWTCVACDFRDRTRATSRESANPERCGRCNP